MGKNQYYAVKVGRNPGIFNTWDEAKAQVDGFSKPIFKGFQSLQEANAFMGNATNSSSAPAPKKTTKATKATKATATSNHSNQIIYTDGACTNNGKHNALAGVGVYFGPGDPRNVSENLDRSNPQTNQRAELTAILRALELCDSDRPIEIFTDSSYSIRCITEWSHKWRKNDWKTQNGEAVKNVDLIEQILDLLAARKQRAMVHFHHVRGHAGIPENEAADRLAVAGIYKKENQSQSFSRSLVTSSSNFSTESSRSVPSSSSSLNHKRSQGQAFEDYFAQFDADSDDEDCFLDDENDLEEIETKRKRF